MQKLLFLFCFVFASIISNGQVVDSVQGVPMNGQDHTYGHYTDHNDYHYVVLRDPSSTLNFLGLVLNKPTGYTLNTTWLIKLDPNYNPIWGKPYDLEFQPNAFMRPTVVVDQSSNIYLTVIGNTSNYLFPDSTFKIDPNGNTLWQIPYSGELIILNENEEIELFQLQSHTDSINGEHISNHKGAVGVFDSDGNYVNHIHIDEPNFAFEYICGKNEFGYFGYRSVLANTTGYSRYEMMLYDSTGQEISHSLMTYKSSTLQNARIIYSQNLKQYFLADYFRSISPINSVDSTTFFPNGFFMTQYDSTLNLIGSVQMSNNNGGVSGAEEVTITPYKEWVYVHCAMPSSFSVDKFTHFGPFHYIPNQSNQLTFGKFDRFLNCKWVTSLPEGSCSYINQMRFCEPQDGGALVFPLKTDYIQYNNVTYNSQDCGDAVYLFAKDNDSSIAYISGRVFIDLNNNGVDDNELGLGNQVINNHFVSAINYSSVNNGVFQTSAINGNNAVTVGNPPQYWELTTPDSLNITVTPNDTIVENVKFGMRPIPGINDVRVNIYAQTPANPGFPLQHFVMYSNEANDTLAGMVSIITDTALFFQNAIPPPDIISGDTLIWNYDSLQPGETRMIQILDSLSANVNLLGTNLNLFAFIDPVTGDTIPDNNYDTSVVPVIGSYDPNDITVNPECTNEEFIQNQNFLEYRIRFQNTGTDTAINVLIKDTLNSDFIIESLEITDASHEMTSYYEFGVLHFYFENIMLPDSGANLMESNGFVEFRIKVQPTLSEGESITNQADIYFDFNPPIETNDAITYISYQTDTISIASCDSVVAPSGNIFNSSGIYFDTIPGPFTCDSIIALDLVVQYSSSSAIQVLDCDNYTSPSGNFQWSTSGNYVDVLTNSVGCDSVINIELTIEQSQSNTQNVNVCSGDSYTMPDGTNFTNITASFSHVNNLVSSFGCDSIITVNVNPFSAGSTFIQQNQDSLYITDFYISYQWYDCANQQIVPGETNQVFENYPIGEFALIVESGGCIDTTDCHVTSSTSLNGYDKNEIVIYPNPSEGAFTLLSRNNQIISSIQIFDLQGNLVYSNEECGSNKIQINPELSSGKYIVHVSCESGKFLLDYIRQ